MFASLLGLLACSNSLPSDAQDSGVPPDTQASIDSASAPLLEVDVLVIGSGPSGLTAAWEAKEAGANVLVLEREHFAGGGAIFASNLLAVGTPYQEERGVIDSPEIAASEWGGFTAGGDSQDPWVQRLLNESADILSWLIDDLGGQFLSLESDIGVGETPRMHTISVGDKHPFHAIIEAMEEETWLFHEATSLVQDAGRVVGVEMTDLRNGERAWIAAKETVIATGGFARNDDEIYADREEVRELLVLYETHHMADGGGVALLNDANAARQNRGNLGLYVHALQDPRPGMEREAIWIPRIREGLILNREGKRVGNELISHGFGLQHVLLNSPDNRLFLMIPTSSWGGQQFIIPGYNLTSPDDQNMLTGKELIELGTVKVHLNLDDVADVWGMDSTTLNTTIATYNAAVAAGFDSEFEKDSDALFSFEEGPFYSMELQLGAAKSFGGAELDQQARVLDENGQAIPGLWAAGEAAGMLGTPAVNQGFSGSVTACYLTGQVAGRNAAAAALGD